MNLAALTADETETLGEALLAPPDDVVLAAAFSAEERRRLAKDGEAMDDGSFPIRNKCLAAGTLVPLLNGSTAKIEDLVGTTPWLYSYDLAERAIKPGLASKVWLSEVAAPLIRVTLDDGAIVECTSNHPFLTRSGQYVPAAELMPGDSLMPLYRKRVKGRKFPFGEYEHVLQPHYGYWEDTHRMVYRGYHGMLPNEFPQRNLSIHHCNGHSSDNRPENLRAVTPSEHRSLHRHLDPEAFQEWHLKGRAARWADPEARAKQGEVMRRENAKRMAEGRSWGEAISRGKRRNLPVVEILERYEAGESMSSLARSYSISRCAIELRLREAGVEIRSSQKHQFTHVKDNHKVVAVDFAGVGDVYDITVPGFSNFALASGVFVHNSDLRNAVAAVGRAADPAKAKAWIKRRAAALDATDVLPKDWLTASVAEDEGADQTCPACGGTGKAAMAASALIGEATDEPRFGIEVPLGEVGTLNAEPFPPPYDPDRDRAVSQAAFSATGGWGDILGTTGFTSGGVSAEVLTAAAAGLVPEVPPLEWFTLPEANAPTALTITADGQVYGHAALWNTCHTGHPGRCTVAPKSRSNYSYFHLGAVETAEGATVATGKITFGAGHAPLTASRAGTAAHYDNSAHAGADVVASDGRHGIWVAGALRPDLPAKVVRTLRAAALSGDWRQVNGSLELIGLLAVNVPGFPVPRAQAVLASAGEADDEYFALVAAGIVEPECEPCMDELLDTLIEPVELDAMLADIGPTPAFGGYREPFGEPSTVPVVIDAQGEADTQRRLRMLAARAVGNEPLAMALENAPDSAFPAAGKTVNLTVNIASAAE